MQDLQTKLKKETHEVQLSVAEQDAMRERLQAYIGYKPLRSARAVVASFAWMQFAGTRFALPAVLVAVLFVSGGVSYAAERALPGDTLYPIKVGVNEEVKAALMLSDESELSWNIRRAERRLEEATVLAVNGDLDTKAQGELALRFEEHASDVSTQVAAVEGRDPALALEVVSEFEASLLAHREVISNAVDLKEREGDEAEDLLSSIAAKSEELALTTGGLAVADTAPQDARSMKTMSFSMELQPSEGAEISSTGLVGDEPVSEPDVVIRITAGAPAEDATSANQAVTTRISASAPGSYKDIAVRMETLVKGKLTRSAVLLDRYDDTLPETHVEATANLIASIELQADAAHDLIEEERYEEAFQRFRELLLLVVRVEVYLRTARLGAPATSPLSPDGAFSPRTESAPTGDASVRGGAGMKFDEGEPREMRDTPDNGEDAGIEVRIDTSTSSDTFELFPVQTNVQININTER